jgi:Domain of unknown function (DUF4403)
MAYSWQNQVLCLNVFYATLLRDLCFNYFSVVLPLCLGSSEKNLRMNPSSLSTLHATLSVSKKHLEQIINTQVDRFFEQLKPQEVDLGDISILKTGVLDLTIVGREIQLSIPVNFHFNGKKLLSLMEAQAGIELLFISKIDLKAKWQLSTKTTLAHYRWLENPDIQIPGFNFSMKTMADQFLEKNKEKIEQQIDDMITNYWMGAGVADLASAFFQRSFPIRADWPVFLQLSPVSIELSPAENKLESIHSHISSQLQIDITSEATKQNSATLPDISFTESSSVEQSNFIIKTKLTYPSLEYLLRSKVAGQSFSYNDKAVFLSDLRCKKSTNGIQLDISVSGYIDGLIELECLPIYDALENFLVIKIQAFKLSARSFWQQGLVNIFSRRIRSELEKRLSYPLGQLHLREEIKQLKEFSPAPGIKARVALSEIHLRNFIVGKTDISFELCTKATLAIALDEETTTGLYVNKRLF